MGTELQQGANAPIADKSVMIGVGWDADIPWDIDVSAFLMGASGKVRSDQDFVFYNQTETPCGSLCLESDHESDQRAFRALLARVPEDVSKIVFTITIGANSGADDCPHCGMIEQLYIRVTNLSGEDLIRFNVTNVGQERALMLGDLYRHQGSWKFRAVGQGYNGGLDALATALGVTIQKTPVDIDDHREDVVTLSRRRNPKQIWTEKAVALQQSLRRFLPQIQAAVDGQINESNTRMIIDKMLMDVFGYAMEEIKAEQMVQGRKADYVLSVIDQDLIVGESKRAGVSLRDKHVFQATSYGAYSGIRWALLTNLSTWRIYHIAMQDIVTASLVFSVDLLPDVSLEDCERLLLISRDGMTRKGMLEKRWNEVSALTRASMVRAILTEDVINKVRLVIKRDTGCSFGNNEIQQTLEDILLHP
ncbi:TerD family protein [Thiocystis violascens]|uniref:Putative stress response protein, TerZ-and CABP1 n=1 Tax=Thiocystis violascens (strain ATCC 17096 / DSM 198 / 6111) TaxID=765911 RepID=I3Y9Z7_THIV6|nr:TerD family protein [Thiocystis violascens]AFL73815.1 putative stress response protein, TerZ- and CABP1 [Thiocystis violascens DSM 198]